MESILNIEELFLVEYSKLFSNTGWVEIEYGEFSDQMFLYVSQMILDYGDVDNNLFYFLNN